MSEPTALVVTERASPIRRLDPEDAIAQAKKWADALMDVVSRTKISVDISGRKYLKVEAWQTLARFNYCWIDTEWTRDIKDEEGRVLGVEARARLMNLDTGSSLGGAEGSCMMDEELETRDGEHIERWSDYYAVKSMAQTRAQGKVGRMAFAWVAVLAGYEGTPAEEMTGVGRTEQKVCPKCQKPAIIKGKTEYGGGMLCFKKKGGCGAKFTDAEWEAGQIAARATPERAPTRPHEIVEDVFPEEAKPDVAAERSILLGRIKAAADKKQLTPKYRADLWLKFCGNAKPDDVDPAALHELYVQILKV